jgi:hypothetical protein
MLERLDRDKQLRKSINYGRKKFYSTGTWEKLLKGKDQYDWPPYTNQFISTAFYSENILVLFYKTSCLNKEINRTEPSPSVRVPCFVSSLLIRPDFIVF